MPFKDVEKRKEYYRKIYKKNHDIIIERVRKYAAEHKEQHRQYNARWYKEHPGVAKNTYLKRVYGITIDDFEEMRKSQDNRCAICGSLTTLVVDHDHITGSVRGLLCNSCNAGVGMFKDDPDIAISASKYLEYFQNQ